MPVPPRASKLHALAWRLSPVALVVIAAAVTLPALAAPRPTAADLDRLGEQVSQLDEGLNLAREQLTPLQASVTQAQLEVAQARAVLRALRARLGARAAAAYEGGMLDPIDALLGADDPAGVVERTELLDLLAQNDGDAIAAARAQQQVFEAAIAQAKQAQAAQARAIAAIAARQAQLRHAYARLVALSNKLATPRSVAIPANLPPAPTAQAAKAVHTALAQIGKPYQWAAGGPGSFDCSGLTRYAWLQAGVSLPHSSSEQYATLPHVARAALEPGDLVFFGAPIHHVGLYIGDGLMVNAPSTGERVQVSPIDRGNYAGAARP